MAERPYNRVLGLTRLVALYALLGGLLWLARPTRASLGAGVPFVALGELLRLWAAGHLRKTDELITSGPYRLTRNPLYLGRLSIFSGLGLAAGPPGWIVLPLGWAVFFAYYLPRKERVEPARLLAHHGDPYRRYRDAVPALWPTVRPYDGNDRARRWSLERMLRNREHWMVVGLVVALAWLVRGASGG